MFARAQWGVVGGFAATQHGVLTRRQADDLGVNRNIVARLKKGGFLREPAPGVLVIVGSVDTWEQRLMIATSTSSSAGVIAFRAAAALHALDGYAPGEVEVVAATWRETLARVATVHVGPLSAADVTVVGALRCTTVARTLCDVATVDPIERVCGALRAAVRNGHPIATIRATAERLHRPGQRGTGIVLDLLAASLDRRADLRSTLRACLAGIEGIEPDHVIVDERGAEIAIVDFAHPASRVAIVAHRRRGSMLHEPLTNDEVREHDLAAQGWRVLYVASRQLRSPGRIRANVLAAIRRQP